MATEAGPTENPTETPSDDPPADLSLDEETRELVAAEVGALLPALTGERRQHYLALQAAAEEGTVPGELQPVLESVLELALSTGRARRLYRAEGERLLTNLYRRTPGGRARSRHLAQLNEALGDLGVSVGMRTLGHYTIAIATGDTKVTLAVRPDGIELDSIS